jgi:oligopeptide/dipeptide ABC transporter ATP-binding protein
MYAGRLVEEGTAQAVFAQPRHPYTRGLLGSIPRADRPHVDKLAAIPGQPPSMTAPDAGCAFRVRCPLAQPACEERPELEDRGGGPMHRDACRRSGERAVVREEALGGTA